MTDLSYSDSETLATTLGLNTDDFVATIATGSTAVTLSSVHATNTKLSTVSVPPTGTPISGIELWADYIYLDVEERKRFAQVSHEYLIEQVQHTGAETAGTIDMTFNHPVKALFWTGATWDNVKLQLNGHDRLSQREGRYFNTVIPQECHENCPAIGINVYSFAFKPEEHQPSGTCNFSRIDNVKMNITFNATTQTATASKLKIYAVNYNVLRVMNGMSSVVFS